MGDDGCFCRVVLLDQQMVGEQVNKRSEGQEMVVDDLRAFFYRSLHYLHNGMGFWI